MNAKETPPLLIVYQKIDQLKPFSRNARTHTPRQINQLSESIRVAEAMLAYFQDTHNLAEGAGAASLAAALKEKNSLQGKRIGIVLTGGNVDWTIYETALAGRNSFR